MEQWRQVVLYLSRCWERCAVCTTEDAGAIDVRGSMDTGNPANVGLPLLNLHQPPSPPPKYFALSSTCFATNKNSKEYLFLSSATIQSTISTSRISFYSLKVCSVSRILKQICCTSVAKIETKKITLATFFKFLITMVSPESVYKYIFLECSLLK